MNECAVHSMPCLTANHIWSFRQNSHFPRYTRNQFPNVARIDWVCVCCALCANDEGVEYLLTHIDVFIRPITRINIRVSIFSADGCFQCALCSLSLMPHSFCIIFLFAIKNTFQNIQYLLDVTMKKAIIIVIYCWNLFNLTSSAVLQTVHTSEWAHVLLLSAHFYLFICLESTHFSRFANSNIL